MPSNTTDQKVFDQFTHKYSLSKTLRFELKPMPVTREFLQMDQEEKERLFPRDQERAKNYQILKYYLDLLHKKFIDEALAGFKNEEGIDFTKASKQLDKDKRDKTSHSETDADQEEQQQDDLKFIRAKITKKFGTNKYLFDAKVINRLLETFTEESDGKIYMIAGGKKTLLENAPLIKFINTKHESDSVFNNFNNFTGYLRGFNENRKNLYKDDGKAGRVATRIVDENMPRFFSNIEKYVELLKRYPFLENNFANNWEDYFGEKHKEMHSIFHKFNKKRGWQTIFIPSFYNSCFLQNDIDFYNYLIKKLNRDINQYSQKLKSEKKIEDKENNKNASKKKVKLPLFEKLHKQILGEVKKKSDFIEITQDTLGIRLQDFIRHSDAKLQLSKEIFQDVLEQQDIEGVYISSKAINTISSRWFLSWDFFGGKILEKQNEDLSNSQKRKKIKDFIPLSILKEVLESMYETKPSNIFRPEYVKNFRGENYWDNFLAIWKNEWKNLLADYENAENKLGATIQNLSTKEATEQEQKIIIKHFADAALSIYQMTKYFALLKGIKEVEIDDKNGEFYQKMDIYLFGDSLATGEKNKENNIYSYYNALRNFLTKKPWSEDKIKLNFDNGNLLGGWSKKEEKVKLGVILRKDNKYYLGIINNKNKSILEDESIYGSEGFEKMEMLSLKWKTLTGKGYKRDFGDKYSNHIFDFKINQYKNYLHNHHINIQDLDSWIQLENDKKDKDSQSPDDRKVLNKIINFLKRNDKGQHIEDLRELEDEPYTQIIKNVQDLIDRQYQDDYPALKIFLNKTFASRKEYEEFKDKYGKEIYTVNFDKKIKRDAFERLLGLENGNEPSLFLFQIFNKDFQLDKNLDGGEKRKIAGKKDIETALFEMLFHDTNLKNEQGVVLTLNGGAEVFFRPWSLRKEKQKEVRGNKEIIAKNRFTEDKILLHVPVTLNSGKPKRNDKNFAQLLNKANSHINSLLCKKEASKKVKIIGIDRGEKHLAYYTVIDQQENILEQGTLNRIYPKLKDGTPVKLYKKKMVLRGDRCGQKRYELVPTDETINYVDYLQILDCREKNRLLQKKSWDSIETIKDLKKGYVSHAVNRLCELFLKYFEQDGIPPIIVFEKLNFGFKQGRQKIDKQVYQNLELALAKKLGYLTKKMEKLEEQQLPGGVINAFQFVPEIKNYGNDVENKSQIGVILYVDPSYTSAICPNCGFRKRMTNTVFESVKSCKKKFNDHKLKINFSDKRYKFTFSTEQWSNDGEKYEMMDEVYSDVSRIYRKPKKDTRGWTADIYLNMTEQFDALFKDRIKAKDEEIFAQIRDIDDADFWKQFMYLFNLILQIRNSSSKKYEIENDSDELITEGEDKDFIHCPHCHFHSDNRETWGEFANKSSCKLIEDLQKRGEAIFNGDVNGAYNIARKGKMAVGRIEEYPEALENFCKKHGKDKKDLEFKKGKCEIIEGKGKNKTVIDSISRYPDLFISNSDWDKFTRKSE